MNSPGTGSKASPSWSSRPGRLQEHGQGLLQRLLHLATATEASELFPLAKEFQRSSTGIIDQYLRKGGGSGVEQSSKKKHPISSQPCYRGHACSPSVPRNLVGSNANPSDLPETNPPNPSTPPKKHKGLGRGEALHVRRSPSRKTEREKKRFDETNFHVPIQHSHRKLAPSPAPSPSPAGVPVTVAKKKPPGTPECQF